MTKLEARLKVMEILNKVARQENLSLNGMKDIKGLISAFARHFWRHNNITPLWFYSYHQGWFDMAVEDLK